jgi:hypothetical protein
MKHTQFFFVCSGYSILSFRCTILPQRKLEATNRSMFLVLISVRTGACSDSKGTCITGALNRKHASGALLYSSTVSPLSNPAVLLLLIERPKRGPMGSYNRDPIPSATLILEPPHQLNHVMC